VIINLKNKVAGSDFIKTAPGTFTPNPTIDTVKKIADALAVSLDNLMK